MKTCQSSILSLNINSLLKAKNIRINNYRPHPLGVKINFNLLRDIKKHYIVSLSDVRLKSEDEQDINSAFPNFVISGCFNEYSSKRELEGSLLLVKNSLIKDTIEKGSFRVSMFTPYVMSYIAYTSHSDKKFLLISLYLIQLEKSEKRGWGRVHLFPKK